MRLILGSAALHQSCILRIWVLLRKLFGHMRPTPVRVLCIGWGSCGNLIVLLSCTEMGKLDNLGGGICCRFCSGLLVQRLDIIDEAMLVLSWPLEVRVMGERV